MNWNNRFWLVPLLFITADVRAASTDSSLARPASWSQPSAAVVREQLQAWLDEQNPTAEILRQVDQIWSLPPNDETSDDILRRTVQIFSLLNAEAKSLVDACSAPRRSVELPRRSILLDETVSPFVRNNLRLYYGQWLAIQQLYNEASEELVGLEPKDVVDPASLLFFQAVAAHRLLDKENCLPTLERLLERSEMIPRRYLTMARLMEADLAPLRTDSLDEVARLMDNIKVRLGHGHAGKRVRKEEDDVVAKLDKMIDKLCQQAQAMQNGSQSEQSGGKQPSSPMQDSMPGGQSGPGNVDPKKLGSDTNWGNLPPKEREAALQELGKEFPSHYRDAIEEYFQKLAREKRTEP
jgi:hypothetical protein